ncbi:MAG: flagellar type III secretion system pore protein FliP [Bacteriovoracaceae bacterium]|nr:flagellar type III secretion system pore protein FliP [Bacteriovoracaceae bacterium]
MNLPGVNIQLGGGGADLVDTMQLLLLFTVLTLAPSILVMCTAFTRILVVLSFLRQAMGTQNMPPNQLLIGLALFLASFVMYPTGQDIYQNSLRPYMEKQKTSIQALEGMETSLRAFMSKQTRKSDIQLFFDVTNKPYPNTIEEVPTFYLIPSFIISELKTAFQIGFLLYIPFLILDMVVASVLMAMGMMMLPPVLISMPFKILLFILVDGWQLVIGSLLKSFVV